MLLNTVEDRTVRPFTETRRRSPTPNGRKICSVENIIDAHTIAPFDHAGGHINPHEGYHYHAATGRTKEVAQPDGHSPMIGYALDGFGIFAHLDPAGNAPVALDECGGHYDGTRGYHYHAGSPGSNQIIGAFRGQAGTVTVEH